MVWVLSLYRDRFLVWRWEQRIHFIFWFVLFLPASWPKTFISHRCQHLSNFFSVDWPTPPLQLSSTFATIPPTGRKFPSNHMRHLILTNLTITLQDPVERSSCIDFYQLVLFYTTAGAAVLGAVGVLLLIFVKAVKRNEKEGRPIKAGSKWTAILLNVKHI